MTSIRKIKRINYNKWMFLRHGRKSTICFDLELWPGLWEKHYCLDKQKFKREWVKLA